MKYKCLSPFVSLGLSLVLFCFCNLRISTLACLRGCGKDKYIKDSGVLDIVTIEARYL